MGLKLPIENGYYHEVISLILLNTLNNPIGDDLIIYKNIIKILKPFKNPKYLELEIEVIIMIYYFRFLKLFEHNNLIATLANNGINLKRKKETFNCSISQIDKTYKTTGNIKDIYIFPRIMSNKYTDMYVICNVLMAMIIVASKFYDDFSMGNKDFARLSKKYTNAKLNTIEKEFLKIMDYNICVNQSEYINMKKYMDYIHKISTLD
jgi:hypothetical protein